jgi:hypothetical protein
MISVAAREGKKKQEGKVVYVSPPETKRNQVTPAGPPETETLTPATTKQALDILIKCTYVSERCSIN